MSELAEKIESAFRLYESRLAKLVEEKSGDNRAVQVAALDLSRELHEEAAGILAALSAVADVERMRGALSESKDCIEEMHRRLADQPIGTLAAQRVDARCMHVRGLVTAALADSADKPNEGG